MTPDEQKELNRQQRLAGQRAIEEQSRRQVRTFFDELRHRTSLYRTVASLGDQVAQEYRGRAVMELLQNAHDVLGHGGGGEERQVSFVLKSSSEQPELLIANSGHPFRRKDFSGICQLAQSPKDPNKSVGNKGLGFRSVLELTTRPEIWSTAPADDDIAFTFGFDPDVLEPIAQVAKRLFDRDAPTDWEFGPAPVVDWSDKQFDEYRRSLMSRDGIKSEAEVREWLSEEVKKYLSPYVLPRFLGDPPPHVARLLDNGHVTVIRLPLDGGRAGSAEEAVQSVREQLVELDEAAMVFLPHLSVLRREIDEEVIELERQVVAERTLFTGGSPGARHTRLRVGRTGPDASDATQRSFRVWSRMLGGEDQPEATEQIAAAVRHLPNRWPEVEQVEVAVAVEDTREARQGALVIFLPTTMKTGIGAHVNAPAYGSLDRKTINFGDEYNELMLEFVTDLALDAVLELVKGPAEAWRGRAVIDLLGQAGLPPSDDPELMRRLRERARDRDGYPPLEQQALILCDGGWRRPGVARTMPSIPSGDPFGEAVWRQHAGFAVASSALDERRERVEALLRSLGGSPDPMNEEWAYTLERMARHVGRHQADAQADPSRSAEAPPDWHVFLRSVLAVLPPELRTEPKDPDNDPLAEAGFLPTEDGRLLSGSDAVRMFFQPLHGADDAADFVGSVPDSLKERIAFLHRDVETHEGSQRRRTEIQKFLDGRFVQSFRREDLLREVIVPSLPELPAEHGSPEAAVCADALAWTLEVIGQEEPEGLLDQLAKLPVACTAGWFAVSEAAFGPGWDGRSGDQLKTVAGDLPGGEGEKLLLSALLPPNDELWFPRGNKHGTAVTGPPGIELSSRNDQFARAGVVDGLRLEACEPIRFGMCRDHPKLPGKGPTTIRKSGWDDWKEAVLAEVKPRHKGPFDYDLRGVRALALLHRRDLGDSARAALSKLILASLPRWEEGWDEVTIRKVGGEYFSQRITSPLKYWLSTLPWLHEGSDEANTPRQEPQPLKQRWLVPPSLLRDLRDRFRHLAPLGKLAQRLGRDEALLCALVKLELNIYPTEEDDRTGPVLLDALAGVVQDLTDGVETQNGMPAGGFDVLLGQVRHAWRHFDLYPEPPKRLELPKRFVVRTRPHKFEVRTTNNIGDAYLPDDAAHTRSLREHYQPIFAMWPKEARGEIGDFLHEQGARRASELQEHCLVDGRPVANVAEASQEIEARLEWLPVVLLSVAAYGGNNPRGPATGAWLKAKERLQRARVLLCDSIEVKLLDASGESVARSEPSAYWMPDDDTLLLNRDVAASGLHDRIAPAAQAMLERQDLLKDLRLVLGSLAGHPQPTHSQVEEALGRAEIDGFDVANIRAVCGIGVLRDRIRPVLKLRGVSDDGLDDAKDASGLTEWLSKNATIPRWPTEDLMAAARECCDDFEMGLRACRVLGDDAALPTWNEALAALGGEYRPVENHYAADQTTRHLMGAARSLRAFAKHVALSPGVKDSAKLFLEIRAVHESFVMDPGWSRHWWTVPFRAVLGALCDRYDGIPETEEHLGAFADADTLEQFRDALKRQDIALEPDPLDDALRNERRVRRVFHRMWRVYRAWLAKQGRDLEHIEQAPAVDLNATRYLSQWSEDNAFEQAKRLIDYEGFLDATDGCTTIDAICEKLGISREDYDRVGPPPREPEPVIVAGKEFVVGRDSIPDLFEYLDRMDIGPVVVRPGPDPPEPTDPPVVVRPRPVTPPSKDLPLVSVVDRGPIVHAPPYLPELVGIVGEMQAYRYLKSAFEINKLGWVAQFRTKVFPPGRDEKDTTDDRLGYDFEFLHPDGKIWCVEVKSTTGDGTSFDVTAGELTAASRLAGSKEKRWRFLRVRRAFSNQPEFDWLPNPFESGAGQRLRLLQGSMTVEYRLSKNSEDDRSAASTPQTDPEGQ